MRIQGITIPENKRIEIGLTAVFGIGRERAKVILEKAGVPIESKPKEISPEKENSIRLIVESYKVEGDLKREVAGNVKRLKDIKSYRGVRHSRGLPTKGQRTKVNSRTVRGNVRRTTTSGKRKLEKT